MSGIEILLVVLGVLAYLCVTLGWFLEGLYSALDEQSVGEMVVGFLVSLLWPFSVLIDLGAYLYSVKEKE